MYLNSKDYSNYYVIDIETESLKPQTIWCAVIRNLDTDQIWRFKNDGSANIYHELKRFIDERPKGIWVGHNAISFDIPVINRLCGTSIPLASVVDTLVLSYLYHPSLPDGHSLEAYGIRLKLPKIEFNDWSKYSEEMLTYCERDVDLTVNIYWAIRERMNKIGFSELSCEIEHKTRVIIDKQERNGFYFNSAGARDLQSKLEGRLTNLSQDVHKLFPAKLEEVGRYIRRRKKDGSDFASYERHLQEYEKVVENDDGSYSCYNSVNFNIGSPKQRLSRLIELGFEPTVFTKKGNPRLDEESLLAFSETSGRPEVAAMANWLVVRGRLNMLTGNPETGSKGWMDYVQSDNRIHGKVLSCGAGSRRMIHSQPNTANIPSAAKAQYGHECRALWAVEPDLDRVLVGYDASGLETVGLLHLLNNPKATEILLKPKPNDVHTSNSRILSELLGRPIDREWGAKTSWYAWLYGAYPPKLGSIVKGPPSDGDLIIKTFFKNVPGLEKLIKEVHSEWKSNKGLLRCVDGGYVRCPSQGAALNYKIQPLGAVVMKMAMILLDEELERIGLWHMKVGDIHDEGQHETDRKSAQKLGETAVQSMRNAGENLNLNVKTDGDYKVGENWAMTH